MGHDSPAKFTPGEKMMRIRFTRRREGPIPSETVVTIPTVGGGTEDVVVHQSQADTEGVEVGFIGERDDQLLVELPRETFSGRWRVWVPKSALIPNRSAAA
jgi:hypothetical protein